MGQLCGLILTVNNMVLAHGDGANCQGVSFGNTRESTISDCTFDNCGIGILDSLAVEAW